MWCIPPAQSAEFVAKMEDVLEVYSRPHDPKRPVVCMDEQPFQLLAETRELIPMSEQNHTVKADHEYERRGACCVFMATEPLGGYRHTEVRETRTKKDWADFVAALLDGPYADAEKVVLVMDNLNTHGIPSLYERFPPGAARRYAERLEIHSPRSTDRGSTSPRSSSRRSPRSASRTAGSGRLRGSRRRPRHGKARGTKSKKVSIGSSQPAKQERASNTFTQL